MLLSLDVCTQILHFWLYWEKISPLSQVQVPLFLLTWLCVCVLTKGNVTPALLIICSLGQSCIFLGPPSSQSLQFELGLAGKVLPQAELYSV